MPDITLMNAERMVAVHSEETIIDDEGKLELRLWHMLMDLRRLAVVRGIDFDATCRDVAEQYPHIYPEDGETA